METKSNPSRISRLASRRRQRPFRYRIMQFAAISLFLLILNFFRPWGIRQLQSHSHPVQSYSAAVQRIDRLRPAKNAPLNPLGSLLFLTHHRKTQKVIVFVHGYTNCPHQFQPLGESFFKLGYNVLIAPLPYHGLADRMTEAHAKLTAEDLTTYSDQVMDAATGLGEQITMVGLSVGGNITAWAAQTRPELDLAVVISPVLGYQGLPLPLTPAITNLSRLLPNTFRWWQPELEEAGGVPHSYPRFSSRALAEGLRLGYAIQQAAKYHPPAASRILMITNGAEPSVDLRPIRSLVANWRKNSGKVSTYQFPARLRLGHDFIDPAQPDAKIDLVYPRLIQLLAQGQ